jgi:hypothetical protein
VVSSVSLLQSGQTFGLGKRRSARFERADIVLLHIGQPRRKKPPTSRAIASAAPHGSDVFGDEPAGIDAVLPPQVILPNHGSPQRRDYFRSGITTVPPLTPQQIGRRTVNRFFQQPLGRTTGGGPSPATLRRREPVPDNFSTINKLGLHDGTITMRLPHFCLIRPEPSTMGHVEGKSDAASEFAHRASR